MEKIQGPESHVTSAGMEWVSLWWFFSSNTLWVNIGIFFSGVYLTPWWLVNDPRTPHTDRHHMSTSIYVVDERNNVLSYLFIIKFIYNSYWYVAHN